MADALKNMVNKVAGKDDKKLILVTGVSGFLGAHVALAALQRGHTVRGTVRSDAKAQAVKASPHFKKYSEAGKLQFAIVDDIAYGDLSQAIAGVDAVAHVASPFHYRGEDYERDYYTPARDGTLNALKAAAQEPKVKALVVTSSFGAVGDFFNEYDIKSPLNGMIYTEKDWLPTTPERAAVTPMQGEAYCYSKKLAEQAAYDFARENKVSYKVSTMCPPMVFGPVVHPLSNLSSINESSTVVLDIINGSPPPTSFPAYADVRDAALAHVLALEQEAEGRFLINNGPWDTQLIVDFIRKTYGAKAANIPAGEPGQYLTANPKLYKLDASRSEKVLGLHYRPFEETFKDAADSLYALKEVVPN